MMKNLPVMQETWVQSLGREDLLRREWQPTPIFFPGEFHEQRSLVGYSLWSCKELDTTEWLTLSGIKDIHTVVQPARLHGSRACFSFPEGNSVAIKPRLPIKLRLPIKPRLSIKPRLPNPPAPSPWHPALYFRSHNESTSRSLV